MSVSPYLVEIGFGVLSLLAGYLTLYLPDIENKAMQNTLEVKNYFIINSVPKI